MWKNRIFIFLSICLFFGFLFHNCAPLAEQGGFQDPKISIFNSETPKKNNQDNDEEGDDEEGDDEEEGDEEEGDDKENDDKEDDEDSDEEESKDDKSGNDEPGPEFFDSETAETGSPPGISSLY